MPDPEANPKRDKPVGAITEKWLAITGDKIINISGKAIILLLMLAYLGQAVSAAVLPCQPGGQFPDEVMEVEPLTMMSHHEKNIDAVSEMKTMDHTGMSHCESADCECSYASCFGAVIPNPDKLVFMTGTSQPGQYLS